MVALFPPTGSGTVHPPRQVTPGTFEGMYTEPGLAIASLNGAEVYCERLVVYTVAPILSVEPGVPLYAAFASFIAGRRADGIVDEYIVRCFTVDGDVHVTPKSQ